jgi:hypothetical protein
MPKGLIKITVVLVAIPWLVVALAVAGFIFLRRLA